MSPTDLQVLHALRRAGSQRTVRAVAEHAERNAGSTSKALFRLEQRALVNIHRTLIRGRTYIRWIVPVDITWRGTHEPETTATNQGAV